MTRTTRKLIIAKLTALYGNRRTWSKWLMTAIATTSNAKHPQTRLAHIYADMNYIINPSQVISMAREVLNS